MLHQVLGARLVVGEQHHADAAGTAHFVAVQRHWRRQGAQHFLGDGLGLLGRPPWLRAQALEHHHELVAAQACHGVVLAHRGHQAPPHFLQQQVALLVPQAVVDQLEVVQVDEHQRALALRALATAQRLLQAVEQQAAVGQAGQRVVVRQVTDFLLGRLALGDVGERADVVRDLARLGLHGGDGQPFGEDGTALAPVPDLARPGAGSGDRLLHCGVEVGPVAPGLHQRRGLANGLLGAVACDLGERAVHAQDHAARVGDEDALLRLEGNGGDAQVFLGLLQLAVVVGKQAARPAREAERAGHAQRQRTQHHQRQLHPLLDVACLVGAGLGTQRGVEFVVEH